MIEPETVSIVGMGLRVPGATSPEQLWQLVRQGTVAISRFEVAEATVGGQEGLGSWVGAEGVLDGVELFDHGAVGMSRGEAELTDPQHRVLLDCASDALQNAAIDPASFDGTIGAFVGSAMSTYLLRNLLPNRQLVDDVGALNLLVHNDKDFAASLLAYRLGLTGPVFSVGAACATSLVAVHLATQALLNHECDVAVAGGVSIQIPQRQGYLAVRDGVYSPSGACRPFDGSADGTVGGSGAGIVVLRRSSDVRDDGDSALASILGSAVNNGGSGRIGFAAPSIEAQAEGLQEALEVGDVDPRSIGYVETHGTGTALGDPMEFAALAHVLGAAGDEPCYIGGVKANVGHLDVAAGVVGLIKAVSGIAAGRIPPLAGFASPNRELDLDRTRLRVPTSECAWPAIDSGRRGVVTSLGAGGTNAFVVLGEAAPAPSTSSGDPSPAWAVGRFSAASAGAAAATADVLAGEVTDGRLALSDVAHSLGRRGDHGAFRGAVVMASSLRSGDPAARSVVSPVADPADGPPAIGLVFPGNCPMVAGSARELSAASPVFRSHLDECLDLWADRGRPDVARVLLDRERGDDPVDIELLQPALFTIQYSLGASLLEALDRRVAVVLGHSLGEWVAGTCAGLVDLESALDVVIARTESLRRSEAGAMAAVSLAASAIEPFLVDGSWLAAENGPDQCVVSGRRAAVEQVVAAVIESGGQAAVLHGDRPGHTPMLREPAAHLADHLRGRVPLEPTVPIVSTRTGQWFADTDLAPWADQLHQPVRFHQAVDTATSTERLLFVEATCGSTVSGLLRRHAGALGAVSTADRAGLDPGSYLQALASLWAAGAEIGWTGQLDPVPTGRRIPLPPNEREPVRCWIDPPDHASAVPEAMPSGSLAELVPTERAEPDRWLWAPTWTAEPLASDRIESQRAIVLVRGEAGMAIAAELTAAGVDALAIDPAVSVPSADALVPADVEDWLRLLGSQPELPDLVVHAWCAESETGELDEELEWGLGTVVALGQALGRSAPEHQLRLAVVVAGTQRVTDEAVPCPERASMLGVTKVLPREMAPIMTQFIDVPLPDDSNDEVRRRRSAELVVDELLAAQPEPLVALRGGRRWVAGHAPVRRAGRGRELPEAPVILVVGGTGGIGLGTAEALAADGSVLVLASRTATTPAPDVAERIDALRARQVNVELCDLDVGDREATHRLVAEIVSRCGRLDCVVHAVGYPDRGGVVLRRDLGELVAQVKEKINSYRHLSDAIADHPLHRFVMTSSIGTVLHSLKYGEVGYVAVNEFVLAFGQQRHAARGDASTIAWTDWIESGMWVALRPELARRYGEDVGGDAGAVDVLMGLTDEEGRAVARDAVLSAEPSLVVSTVDLDGLLAAQRVVLDHDYGELADAFELQPSGSDREVRWDPATSDPSDLAAVLADHWSSLLGTTVRPADNFFELGGDSLIALRVLAQVERDLGIAYPMAQFLVQPDLAAFTREIEQLVGVSVSERFSF